MTFDVETKDCTALSDGELADMADIVADGPAGLDIGVLSKQRDEWVLITQVRVAGPPDGLLFLHSGAHRGHAVHSLGPRVGEALHRAGSDLGRPAGRSVPQGCARLPRRGRPGCDQAS